MDEPFGALDAMTREKLDMEILDIWKKLGTTVIFITHNVEEAVLLSDRVYVMGTNPGRITREITLDLERPRSLDKFHRQWPEILPPAAAPERGNPEPFERPLGNPG